MLTIDDFTVVLDDATYVNDLHLHVVTHCHKDHIQGIPRTGIICATQWTLDQLPYVSKHVKTVTVAPDNEYFGFLHIFQTVHSTGSIGVWIPLIGYLHLGDGRITPNMLQHIRHKVVGTAANVNVVVVDGLYYKFNELTFDSIANQVETFRQHIHHTSLPPRIRLHAGTCYLLSLLPYLTISLDDDDALRASHLTKQLTNDIVAESDMADVVVCFRDYDCAASSMFFACDKYMQKQNITIDAKGVTRICFSTHASYQETQALLDVLKPYRVLFETPSHLRVTQRLQCSKNKEP